DGVAALGRQLQGAPEVRVGVVETAQFGIGVGQAAVGEDLGLRVLQAAGGGNGGALDGDLVVPVDLPVQERPQRPGQLPDVGVQPGLGRQADGAEQDLVLGGEPGERLLAVGGALGGYLGGQAGQRD